MSSRRCCPRPTTTRSASSPSTAPRGSSSRSTIVSGMTTKAQSRTAGVQLRFPHDRDTYALRVSARVTTEEFERYAPIDEQMDFHEKLRLLYVAMTRARDHLVVSVHRAAREPGDDRTTWTHARAAVARRGRRARVERVRRRCGRGAARGGAGGRRHARHAPAVGRVAARARRRVRHVRPARSVRSATAIARGGRGGGGGRPRAAQGPTRPRAAAVEQGPLRHCARPRGARGPADGRSRHR